MMSRALLVQLRRCLIMLYVPLTASCLVRLQRSTCNFCNNIMQVSADVLGCLKDKGDIVTLDICTSLLPLLTGLLESNMDRYASGSPSAITS